MQVINNPQPHSASNQNTLPNALPATYADLIVDYLAQIGVDIIFGVPGGAIEPLLNALARSARNGGLRLVVARHECSAAFMADGYFRETGRMSVVFSTTGPGATNLITGVASAAIEEIPMLVITAQTPLPKFGKGALQESSCTAIDTVGIFRYITGFSTLVSHHEQLENKLITAIMTAHRTPCSPVHISIPSDILRASASIHSYINNDLLTHHFSLSDDASITQLCEKMARVRNVVLYLGGDIVKANEKIMGFIELTGVAFVTSPMGKGWIDETHPQYRGVYGFAGHESAKNTVQNKNVDLIIAAGTNLNELGTSGWQSDLLNTKLVHIDSSAEHFTRSPMANLHVLGDLQIIFERLITCVHEARKYGKTWETPARIKTKNIYGGYTTLIAPDKCNSTESPLKPQRLMYCLSQQLPDNTRIFIDAGNAWSWATHYLCRKNHEGLYRIAMCFGSMTWSIGAAIGSALANRASPTLCIVGDGSYLMCAQEITVAAQQKLPIVFLILNDSVMGMVMHGQRMGHQESIGWELNEINYAAMAEAMGIKGIIIENSMQLENLQWENLFAQDGPTLVDVRIDREEEPPMGDRIKGLGAKGSVTPGS